MSPAVRGLARGQRGVRGFPFRDRVGAERLGRGLGSYPGKNRGSYPMLPLLLSIMTALDDKDPEVKPEKEIVTIYATGSADSANPTDRLIARHSS